MKRRFLAGAMALVLVVACVGSALAKEVTLPSNPDIAASIVALGESNTGKVIVQFDIASSNQGSDYQDGFIGIADSSAEPQSEAEFPIVLKATDELDTGTGNYIYMLSDGDGMNAEMVAGYGKDVFEHYQFTIDLDSKTYSCVYAYGGLAPVVLAENYAFKPGVDIDDIGKLAIYSADSSLTIKNLLVLPAEPKTNEWRAGYMMPEMESGVYALQPDIKGVVTTEFDFVANVEGVFGGFGYVDTDFVAPDASLAFKSLPIIFNMNSEGDVGFVQFRNGGAYEGNVPFEVGKPIHFKVTLDLDQKTFDVWADGVQAATAFAFRADPETTTIDDLGKIVIFALAGPEKACNTYSILNHTVNGVPSAQ